MSENQKAGRMLFDFTALFFFVYLLIRPSEAGKAVESGVSFCVRVIIPSLFIFFVLSRLFMGRVLSIAGKNLPAALIIGGILCGFPVGAKMVRQLHSRGLVTKRQAELLVSCSDNASASFIISFAGANVLGSVKAGALLCAGKAVVTFIWYFFASRIFLSKEERHFVPLRGIEPVSLADAVKDSARIMADICACIVLFMCVGEVVKSFLPENELIRSAVRGFFEFSGGIELCRLMKPGIGYILTAMMLGWSGVCVHMQVSIAAGKKIGMNLYYADKTVECLLMGLFAVLTKSFAF